MATKLQIANSALVKCGARTVSDITGPEKEARICNERFTEAKRTVLRLYSWNFAIERTVLDVQDTAPAFGFTYAFAVPVDFMKVVEVNEGDEEWRLERGRILSDSDEIRLRYVYDYPEDGEFPEPLFNECLAIQLAIEISYSLVQSGDLRESLRDQLKQALPMARHVSSTEHSGDTLDAQLFLRSRFGRGQFVRDPGT